MIPGMKATGMNTAESTRATAMIGPLTSSIALEAAAVARRHSFLDVVLDRLDDEDRVVDDQPDREHQPEERQRVDRKAQQRKYRERTHQRNRHGEQRDERRPPVLQKQEDDQDDERRRPRASVFTTSRMPSVTGSVVSSEVS